MNTGIRELRPDELSMVAGGLTADQWRLAASGTGCVISFAALGGSAGANILAWGAASATCGVFFSSLYSYYQNNAPQQSGNVEMDYESGGSWHPDVTEGWDAAGSFESTFSDNVYSSYESGDTYA